MLTLQELLGAKDECIAKNPSYEQFPALGRKLQGKAKPCAASWFFPVRLTSGLPGGIGALGSECGGLTSPIMALGLAYGEELEKQPLQFIVTGQKYLDRFKDLNTGVNCREIAGTDGKRLPCLKAICRAPGLLLDLLDEDAPPDVDNETVNAYARLLQSFRQCRFHCAHNVLHELNDLIAIDGRLLHASWGFLGGTLLQGMTCSALTAGVLVIGMESGEIENSYIRVLRWMGQPFVGGDAMRDDLNKFNRAINVGHELALWFTEEFKSSNCRDILDLDLSTVEGIDEYISGHRIERCREITHKVALRVRGML